VSSSRISLVIPTRNGATRLPETLRAIATQELAAEVEVVIADDGSGDGTGAVAERFVLPWGPPRVVRHPTSRGRAAACNSGVDAARGEVVILLDDDMTLHAGALEAHRAFHAAHPRSAARARVVLAAPERDSCFLRFLAREEAMQEQTLLARRDDVPFPLSQTGHFSIRRALLIQAGGFDTGITRYGFEDIELGYRLAQLGVRIRYLPEAASTHRAYITELDRYLARHLEAGIVARQLAARHPHGPLRDYLRVDPPRRLGVGVDPAGLVLLRISNRLLLWRPLRRALGSRAGFGTLRAVLRAGEALGAERAVHFGYHVARDVRYLEGVFGERSAPESSPT